MFTEKYLKPVLAVFAVMAVTTSPAFAQAVNSTGAMVAETGKAVDPFMILLVGVSYLIGVWLLGSALILLGKQDQNTSWGDVLLRAAGGSLMVSLPSALGVGLGTLLGETDNYQRDGSSFGEPSVCIGSGASSEGPLACILKNVEVNLVPVFIDVAFAFMVLFGLFMIAKSIYSMAVSHAQGQRGQGASWQGNLILGIILTNLPAFLHTIEETLGVGDGVLSEEGFNSSSSLLSYTGPSSSGVQFLAEYTAALNSLLTIFVMFGIVAIIRGFFILKAVSDGGSQKSFGAGVTHIVGGVALANAKFTICIVTNTVLGIGNASGFC
ncbi:hypothetical protein ACFOY8_12770 [Thalassospira xianhensis]|uniref:Uncharacterized protein n=1 Tax=Thalassospira xianhensis MCCC 1A02616 TaxID=1177929 RepID=A0A367UE79_9PROT|nr:hypothetical protein [Thalassospira xianhensis]RCK06280.1 hypothetical protein TH5_08660 [Thalassospira xianhensis MCCC 1A02616]